MNIVKKIDGSMLEVALEGRLDTNTAPELEKELKESLDQAESLRLNFEKLEYISSAGLRVVLGAEKIMRNKGGMVLCNVNDVIMEVLDITGFTDILTIE